MFELDLKGCHKIILGILELRKDTEILINYIYQHFVKLHKNFITNFAKSLDKMKKM